MNAGGVGPGAGKRVHTAMIGRYGCTLLCYASLKDHLGPNCSRAPAMDRSKRFERLRQVEAIQVHYLVPGRDEVVDELLLRVGASVNFRQRAELGI